MFLLRSGLSEEKGLTLVEFIVGALLFSIVALGLGYLAFTVIPTQRAYHMAAVQNDALRLSYLLRRDLINAVDWTVSPTVGTPVTTLSLETKLNGVDQHVEYRVKGAQIQRCQVDLGDICSQSDFKDLLNSWDDGSVEAESGTRFIRGIDVDGDGLLSEREKHFIRAELVLSQNEGPEGERTELYQHSYYIEVLTNIDGMRLVN